MIIYKSNKEKRSSKFSIAYFLIAHQHQHHSRNKQKKHKQLRSGANRPNHRIYGIPYFLLYSMIPIKKKTIYNGAQFPATELYVPFGRTHNTRVHLHRGLFASLLLFFLLKMFHSKLIRLKLQWRITFITFNSANAAFPMGALTGVRLHLYAVCWKFNEYKTSRSSVMKSIRKR